ncbi:MAG: DUF4169 family protein [Caulobacter sp.]|nr:DUF4169 family protein [Caulobacter sp.]
MAELINLNKARKARDKARGRQTAVENRAKFGRTGAETALEKARREKAEAALDGAKRAPGGPSPLGGEGGGEADG